MPKKRMAKRGGRKHFGKKKKGFAPKSGASGRKGVMVNRTAARLHTVVSPHYLTKLEYGFTGHQALAANTNGYFSIWMNGLHFPGSINGGGAGDFTNGTNGGTLYPAALAMAALNPIGFSQLAVLYARYRVLGSKIQITCTPDTSDQLLIVGPDTDRSDVIATDTQRALAQPYHKSIQCTQTNNVKQNTIQLYMDCPTVAGLTKQQYYDNPNVGSLVATNPSDVIYWNIYQSSFTAAIAQANNYVVKVTYWCEFYEPLPPTDI